MKDSEYFELWHEAQYLRDKYDLNYVPDVHIETPPGGLFFSPPPYVVVNHDDQRPLICAVIGRFLGEYNRRHAIPITVDEYLKK